MHNIRPAALAACIIAAVLALVATNAQANCGSSFCAINTDWNVQGVYADPGARAELRYEYLKQDRLRSGRDKMPRGQSGEHHDELSTINQALFATVDYNFASGFGMSAVIPMIDREHEHIHNHLGTPIPEEWNYTRLGDIRLTGRYQFDVGRNPEHQHLFGVMLGVKLPTGATDITNDDGDAAERSLQPGTGTTDPLIGAYYQMHFPAHGLSLFTQATYAWALNDHDEFKPGKRVTFDAGVRYALTYRVSLLLQLNTQWKGRDSGAQAEPDDSGGTFVFLSPGVSVNFGRTLQLFGLLQLPVYQNVNGLQLTSDWGATAGIGYRF